MRNSYFSVGEHCSTAYQIRRITGNQEAYFFDWLVTRGDSFDFLSKPNDSLFQSGHWEIIEDGIRVIDKHSRLVFQHEFKTFEDQPGKIDPQAVEAHLPAARAKFIHLKNKLIIKLGESERTVMIRAENSIKTLDEAKERLRQLQATFLPINRGIRFILASIRLQDEECTPHHLITRLNVPTSPPEMDAWKGDNRSWERLFELAEKTLVFPEPEPGG